VSLLPKLHILCYIFQDFYNLVDVYLDAVFFPKCVEDFQTFQQEGWHYELDKPDEEISYKGENFCFNIF
jgi:presequence protease